MNCSQPLFFDVLRNVFKVTIRTREISLKTSHVVQSSKSKPLPQGVSIRPRYMSTNKGNLTIRAEMLADSTKKAQIAPKCFGSPAHSWHFQLVGGKHHPNLNVPKFPKEKRICQKIFKNESVVNLQWFLSHRFSETQKWYQHRPQTVQVNQWNQILLTTTFCYFLLLLLAIFCPSCAWCEKDCCSWLAALHFAIFKSLVVDVGWFILLPECWQTAKYSGINFGYNYAEAQKRRIISECNLGYTTVLLILFNAETHVQFNFGDTISDLDVAFRTRSSFSNSYCCVETVN